MTRFILRTAASAQYPDFVRCGQRMVPWSVGGLQQNVMPGAGATGSCIHEIGHVVSGMNRVFAKIAMSSSRSTGRTLRRV
jgi:hypothetical protein